MLMGGTLLRDALGSWEALGEELRLTSPTQDENKGLLLFTAMSLLE